MNTIYFMTLLMRLERLHDKGLLPETLEEGGGVMCKFCVLRLVWNTQALPISFRLCWDH